jgi:N-acetylglucosaminyldiphosphoundecaprenol N-acetyl-beta-D-mannosaminyltransferase
MPAAALTTLIPKRDAGLAAALQRKLVRTSVAMSLNTSTEVNHLKPPPFVEPGEGAALDDVPLVWIGGLPVAVIDRAASARLLIDLARARRGKPPPVITSANGQVISLIARDRDARRLFLAADLIHADGMPLVFASRLRSPAPLPERVATTDLFHDVARLAEIEGASFYLLGAEAKVIDRAVGKIRERYPRLAIAGYRSGYFEESEDKVVDAINAAAPDVLWVGMGVPRELSFALGHRHRLTEVGVIKTSGGLFDFLSGKNRRAPAWMQAAGLEWLYRTTREPRRLLMRYVTTNPHAAYLLLTKASYQASSLSVEDPRRGR